MATDLSPDYRLGYSHGVGATQQEYEEKLDEMYEDGYEAGCEVDSEDSYNEGFEEGRKSRWGPTGYPRRCSSTKKRTFSTSSGAGSTALSTSGPVTTSRPGSRSPNEPIG